MKTDLGNEHRFIAEVDAFEFVAQDLGAILDSLNAWFERLCVDLQAHRLVSRGLTERSPLARHADAINTLLRDAVPSWARQWASLEPASALADHFDDKVLLLVFGKFNAGKSSLCNFLADRFAAHGKAVQYFHLDGGRIVETSARLEEGTTETTARLQGVRLGENLVLLDTPGLHSMTLENAALTQRFTDSADAVLWLTSSTSPGQVQELDDIARELHRNKPLLPVVTRSDAYDEDEIDGEIVKALRNKTARNRALQEADVAARAAGKLVAMGVDAALLRTPVSLSVHVAREQGQTPAALTEAGFDRLYGALLAIGEPALAYKRRKCAEMLLHHLEENVLRTLLRDVLPLLDQMDEASRTAVDLLEQQREKIAAGIWRSVMPTLPELLERHAETRDVTAIRNGLSQSVLDAFAREANEHLAGYVVATGPALATITVADDVGYEDIVVARAAGSGHPDQVVGVDYRRLHGELVQAVRESLLSLASHAADQCRASIGQLASQSDSLKQVLWTGERELRDLEQRLRSGAA
ncbi:dynamin family protein [Paraburkholderia caballeronis]|uniref:dynamin family protein n=1 Tax=Paraburkholderia caballeronis TaxID=416943 RepID=UPI00106704B2|nr:dynamin family protein [Paraburkholderia caballeronis]TDV11741.1 50S ribosome-binding GTPase [Paraburkholderia caballeronis]TDV14822.1 50S ribosome-binding GTPase [Paraburkholderia caballeronis]TDV23942.1 50S ribosome-binding GTPase [Paraburkholderia caballeronis]